MAASSPQTSSLLYSCIANRTTILVEASAPGTSSTSASSLASVILPKISHTSPQKLTYTHEHLFVHYIADSPSSIENSSSTDDAPNSHAPLSFLVVSTVELGRRIPFAFLIELKRKFLHTHAPESTDFDSLPPYGCASFGNDLNALLHHYNTAAPSDALASARKEVNSVRGIMTENIERVLERGERIDLLVDKTDKLGGNARNFRMRSRGLKTHMWWKNIKMTALLSAVVMVIVYLLVGAVCGLPGWGSCVGS